MQKLTQSQLNQILADHALWFDYSSDGKRADLAGANLEGLNLELANLQGVDLTGADLMYSNLSGADLEEANLTGANLKGANLKKAILYRANLWEANLEGANLKGADLRGVFIESSKQKQLGCYMVLVINNFIGIGCKTHLASEWDRFNDSTIARMDNLALDWWKINKASVFEFYNEVNAVSTLL